MSPNSRLVYSTDASLGQKYPKCKEALSECVCPPDPPVAAVAARR